MLSQVPYWFMVGVAVSLGLSFGSFLNVVIYRLPRDQSLVSPRSRCPNCAEPIRSLDNLPLFGWLLLRGRARCCKAPISAQYPMVEAIGGVLAWAIVETKVATLPGYESAGLGLAVFLVYLALVLGLVAVAFIDLQFMYIPDSITLTGAAVGVATAGFRAEVGYVDSLVGAALGFLMIWLPFDVLYRKLRGKTGMAMGDAKLVMLAGAWFGLPGAFFALMAGSVQGTLFAIITFFVQGSIEEPDAVKEERLEARRSLEEAAEEERAELAAELAQDPVLEPPEPGLMGSRLAFGAFLALAIIEYLLFGRWLLKELFGPWII